MNFRSDFIIIGSGIVGLRAAVELAPAGDTLVITKAGPSESNTEYAQGGIAAAIGAGDSPALHAADTLAAGDGLCDEDAVRVLTEEGPRYTLELLDWGARFDLDADGRPALASEGAHSVRRVLHARDATGREIGRVLWERATANARLRVLENARVTGLIVEDGRCTGVRFVDEKGESCRVLGRATLLATGGAGQVFSETTNPAVATGDGAALAFRAGARLADMEFVQFHPTALNVEGAPRFLLSEALRGEGARLVNADGDAFMPRYHPSGDLAPRDVVARSIVRESERTGAGVWLSLRHLDAAVVHRRFPTIAAALGKVGLDLARDLVPVGPAAHYLMGGVETDLDGRTSVPRLFAAGEVACTRVHGANRLASNSLLEGLVFGARAGAAMIGGERAARLPAPVYRAAEDVGGEAAGPPLSSEDDVRRLMWTSVGLFRDRQGLRNAVARLDACDTAGDHRLDSLVTVARLIARAALRREESRGAHFRTDFPTRDDLHLRVHFSDVHRP